MNDDSRETAAQLAKKTTKTSFFKMIFTPFATPNLLDKK